MPADVPFQHLWPEEGPFDPPSNAAYESAVASVLFRGRTRDRPVQMVSISSHEPESAVFLEEILKDRGLVDHVAVCVRAGEPVQHGLRPGKKLSDVPITAHEAPIDDATFREVERAWFGMVSTVRHEDTRPEVGDGDSYHFSWYEVGQATRSGYTTSPPKGGPVARLMSLSTLLCQFAEAPSDRRAEVREQLVAAARVISTEHEGFVPPGQRDSPPKP